jgi:hypothetical protein
MNLNTLDANYIVVPIPEAVAREVRETRKAPGYGHPAPADIAGGYGPCRLCLQPLAIGQDERLLFTYDPFAGREPFPLPGPIYIHAAECSPHDDGTFPDELRFIPLTLNAYASGRHLVAQERLANGQDLLVEHALASLFSNPSVAYVHIRNTEAGCFIAQAERR